jgi:cytochrome c553
MFCSGSSDIQLHHAAVGAVLALLSTVMNNVCAASMSAAEMVAAGKQLYRDGHTVEGKQLKAAVHNDVPLQATDLACANCHRRSGLGSSEGGIGIPPIAGTTLFMTQSTSLVRDYQKGELSNISRPAYTLQTLARALREGITASGRPMLPLMPRYQVSDDDVAALAAYLKTLSGTSAEGLTEHDIHFATIITPAATSEARAAMLDVMNAYVAGKNAGTRGETRRAERAPFHREWMYSAYRKWVLHEWTLRGPEESWGAQLEEYYRQQPVFAVLGGIGQGDWKPVHEFCEQYEMPCLFPHLTAAPSQAERDFYSIYFSRGLLLEAEVLAAHLRRHGHSAARVLQVLRPTPDAMAAAATLRRVLSLAGEDHIINAHDIVDSTYWRQLLQQTQPDILVLWLHADDLAALTSGNASFHHPTVTYLSSTLLPAVDHAAIAGSGQVYLLHPFQLPGENRKLERFRIWARQAGVQISDLRLQADAYFVATLLGEALMHIRGNLSREYLIERIEHMTDSMLYTSTYPRLGLAPAQRYAAKGAYVWRIDQEPDQAEWIVPQQHQQQTAKR